MKRWLFCFLLVGLLVLPWTTHSSRSTNLGVILAQDNPYVTVYTLPGGYDPKFANLSGSYSYSHKVDGTLMDGARAGNVVKTSRGRILATVLTTADYHGSTIDGIGVYDITEGKNVFGVALAMGEKTLRSARSGEWRFKAQIRDGSRVYVWADPNLLDQTTRDSYYLLIDDLYAWRAAKVRDGADLVTLGGKQYHVIVANSPGASAGWAFFEPEVVDEPGGRVRPRYFVTTTIRNNGEFVRPSYPLPIGDSGYFSVYDRATDRFTFREGGDRPLRWPDEVPDLPRERPLPDIPTIPDLLPVPPDLPEQNKIPAADNDAAAYYQRAFSWYSKGDHDRAIKDYDEAIRLDPRYAVAFNFRGLAWNAKGDFDKAISDYSEAVRLDPGYADAFNNRGVAWYYKKEYDRALRDFDEAIRLNPNLRIAYWGRGLTWYAKREYDWAIEDFTRAIELDPNFADAYGMRALAWEAKGEKDKAAQDRARAEEIRKRGQSPRSRSSSRSRVSLTSSAASA